jgi:hypothetical protein
VGKDEMNKFELFIDKVSSIVLDSVTNEEMMEIVKEERFWGGEIPYNSYFDSEFDEEFNQQDKIYEELLISMDKSYFEEQAEIQRIMWEING